MPKTEATLSVEAGPLVTAMEAKYKEGARDGCVVTAIVLIVIYLLTHQKK